MPTNAWVRWILIFSFLNVVLASYLLLGRPDLSRREDAEKIFALAEEIEKAGDYGKAEALYTQIMTEMSWSVMAPKAGYALAEIHKRHNFDMEKARTVLRQVADFEESEIGDKAQSDLAFIEAHWGDDKGEALKRWFQASEQYRAERYAEAINLLSEIESRYPQSTLVPHAMFRQGSAAEKSGYNSRAIDLYRSVAMKFPSHSVANNARKRFTALTGVTLDTGTQAPR